MPTLQLRITPPQSATRLAVLARRLTELSTELLGKRKEVTAVVIDEVMPGRWYIDAQRPREPSALLEISITRGTNTEAEKQGFIAAAWRELEQQLGPLEAASYVVVRELPASDWGYAGTTQAARRQQAEAAGASANPA
jgi:4-oxalocrotonate tautomerase